MATPFAVGHSSLVHNLNVGNLICSVDRQSPTHFGGGVNAGKMTFSSARYILPASAYCIQMTISTGLSINCRNPCDGNVKQQFRKCLAWTISNSKHMSSLRLDKQQSIGYSNFSRNPTTLHTRKLRGFELYSTRAGFKKKVKSAVKDFELSLQGGNPPEFQEDLPQLAVSLPLGLASFEALFLVGWVASLRGLLPGARIFFSAADLILCSIMFANCAVGWYALEHSRSEIDSLPREKWWSEVKAAGPGLIDFLFSLTLSVFPFANLFLWLRFARRQKHLPAKGKAAIVANAFVYEGPRLFTILLLLSGGLGVFFQVGLVSNVALFLSALHRPFEEARIKNEKVLMEVTKSKKLGGKKAQDRKPQVKEISAEEREKLDRLRELEEFDMLLAQSSPKDLEVLPGNIKDWSVADTMRWLGQQGLARYANTFAENNIDGGLLLEISNDDLRDELGIQSFGDRRKLELLIKQLKDG